MLGRREGCAESARWELRAFLSGVTVLVVDDDADIRDAVGLLLQSSGACVHLAVDGADALTQLDASGPDLLLCDLTMPHLDGLALIQRVRRDPARADLPSIAMSAFADAADCERTARAGFDGHVGKPFDSRDLDRALQHVMSKRPEVFKRQRARLRERSAVARTEARDIRARASLLIEAANRRRATRLDREAA